MEMMDHRVDRIEYRNRVDSSDCDAIDTDDEQRSYFKANVKAVAGDLELR
jgi:hypothetical protein